MTKADVLLYTGILSIVAGVSCCDWRAGMIVGGVLSTAAGFLIAMR